MEVPFWPRVKQTLENPIQGELYSVERLEEYALYLAAQLEISDNPRVTQPLLPRMRENGTQLLASYRTLIRAVHRKEIISPAGEWLVDNFHIVEEQVREIHEDLPPAFYKELPKIALGELTGYPRIYALALALVAHTDSQLEPTTIRRFIDSFQHKTPLRIGELWALAITLRLVLVENLRRIAVRVVVDHEKRARANALADQLFEVAGDTERLRALALKIPDSCNVSNEKDCAFTAQIVKRLRDQEPELWPALEILEKHLVQMNSSTELVVHLSHQLQASNQVTVANIITSMRLISSLNWSEFFESVSRVDRTLEQDPVYREMDFSTRDRYRHVIEKIAKRTGLPEIGIAEKVFLLTRSPHPSDDPRKSHVGYYLVGRGVLQLEAHFRRRIRSRTQELIFSNPNLVYFGVLISILTAICALPIFYAARQNVSLSLLIGIAILILIPCSELALSLENILLTHLIRPVRLPKLALTHGIPENSRTLVVIPCMLTGKQVIQELLEKLEIHYLGNSDPQLFFSLLTDFADGIAEKLPEDDELLQIAHAGITRLNVKYPTPGDARFHLLHRRREWNPSEKIWMGWERKRGKIHELNRVLRGGKNTSFSVISAPDSLLTTIRYVITLDADTQLPRGSAIKMVGTILHPLNQPRFDPKTGRITQGYGILQPRIGISLESSSKTFFSRIFSGCTGIDPYTTAVSDVYQDLFHEGSYTGKGLYAVDAFEAALENRIPVNTILSHDLFEGLYSRTALLTDVELLDDYPATYRTFFMRQHRWIRGDWQISAWILPFAPDAKGKWVRNRLSLISKWKILDNLRRSLVAPLLFLWFILAWTAFPGSPVFWTSCAFLIIALPCLASSSIEKIGTNLFLTLFYLQFLGHQACVHVDAIVRVIYRKSVSRTRLLEWTSAAQAENQETSSKTSSKTTVSLLQKFWFTEGILGVFALLILELQSSAKVLPLLLLLFWMSFPLAANWISRERIRRTKKPDEDDLRLLRQVARRTWHFFETFVNEENHWLPPDNHQEYPEPITAHRTSPTNIGLYILSLVSARDLGYVSVCGFMNLLKQTLATLRSLEQYEGHYLNWYDTKTLQPLHPRYVSTVDSGNLAGYLLTGRQACLEIPSLPVIDQKLFEGIRDLLSMIENEIRESHGRNHGLYTECVSCGRQLNAPAENTFTAWASLMDALLQSFEKLRQKTLTLKFERCLPWIDSILLQLHGAQYDLAVMAPWTKKSFSSLATSSPEWPTLISALDQNSPLGERLPLYSNAITRFSAPGLHETMNLFLEALREAREKITLVLNDAQASALFMEQKFKAMNFAFLLDQDREVFSIGYSISDNRFDSGLYDLLGSESRLASFVAIAKGDVSQEHWFRLGRQLVPVSGGRALVSWSASMFEYLMPLLILRSYENTLLYETTQTVVSRQIGYGNEHGIPWGISEAGYNARDLQLNYQYGPFGIPGLGLKRGLGHDLVISPYSTLLAAMVNPMAALENIRRLIRHHLLKDYGFYEAVDYTSERLPENQKFSVIQSFMAHHQGMSLAAINNVLHENILQDRFHQDPRVRATRLLLQERIPQGVAQLPPKAAEIEMEGPHQATTGPFLRRFTDPNSSSPKIQLLSNRTYSLMISTAGGGYSKCGDSAVTRWQEDATRDHSGSYIFIRDLTQNEIWSATYQPFCKLPQSYKVTLGEERVEFRRRDGEISSYTQILIAPEDNVEIRHVTLTNHSAHPRELELTSYLEPVLGPLLNDLDHPAFSKLFIETEFLPSKKALLAKRRKRSGNDHEKWGLHVVVTDGEILSDVEYETDRARFIGRGRNLAAPFALTEGERLSNTCGATLDPILSLRLKVRIPAGNKCQVSFTTGMATSRDEALELADRYHDIHSFERESKMAWTKSQVDIRHLNITSEMAQLYQRLAERILYSEASLRPPAQQREANTNVQSSLWPSGISGDLPIVAVSIHDQKNMPVVRQLLRCHEYLRLKGLVYDLIILNEYGPTYSQELQDLLQQQVRSTGSQAWFNKPGGVFILRSDITPEKDIAHIQSVARVNLTADEPLKDQINRKSPREKYPALLSFPRPIKAAHPLAILPKDLAFFNGLGGFSSDGREYIITLHDGQWTPAPWINVIGNKVGFGFQVSETGSGFTWSINSQSNRLTPWSNDPVSDPSGEIIYLRDDETGELWTPTPLPIRSKAPYTIRHGQGYTIFEHTDHGLQHTLTLFVPKDAPVKLSLLKLKNITRHKRKITLTGYTEWVLGVRREKTAPFLICNGSDKGAPICARNPHENEFATRVAFADTNSNSLTFTCSRREFLGRNGNPARPEALKRNGLSQKGGTGQDPCAALQISIELQPGEEREFVFSLGQGEGIEEATQLALHYRDLATVKQALQEVIEGWNRVNDVVQIKTPEPAMDLLMNRWLPYQNQSCRYWSRTAFYQSGGAFGFRDQLQDCMGMIYSSPELAREHILRASQRQFKEGDVQHWWHIPSGRGVRTRMSDDLLWLPYVVCFYIKVTGDQSILKEQTSFLEAPLLTAEEEDSYTQPLQSTESATVFEHCVRAINHSLALGSHGLPLIGTGDWNDGMNRVGFHGQGESIWLGWFLHQVLTDFIPICDQPEHLEMRKKYEAHLGKLKTALEKEGWDGDWYKRAFFDDGTPLGSASNEECRIDSIAQSWAVLSKAGDPDRAERAMQKVWELLVRNQSKMVLLFTPPFNKLQKDPGYIKGYVPGVRENGGQYTHAAAWVVMAEAELGHGDKAFEIFKMLNPILHSQTSEDSTRYKIEPYVMAADVYAGNSHEGQGGWSWYTGSASWYYRAGLESILGFHLRGTSLEIKPCIPADWKHYEISYTFGQAHYEISVKNPQHLHQGTMVAEMDGVPLVDGKIPLVNDGKNHNVTLTITPLQKTRRITPIIVGMPLA